MDVLPLPGDPTFPTPETPYLSSEEWDLGPFQTYLDRKYEALGLKEAPQLPTDTALLTLPLQRIFDGIPAGKLQGFLQTWLYFGLMAEFLGLNETSNGERYVALEQAREEIAALHREMLEETASGDRLLSSMAMLSKTPLFTERVKLASDIPARYMYLHNCLERALLMINNCYSQLDFCIRYSIAGVAEIFMTSLYATRHLVTPVIPLPVAGFNWFRDYIREGGDVEKQMLSFGWCPSEIQKLRNLFQGVASLHYVSRLRPRTEASAHVNCTSYSCRAFQIDIAKYRPRHVTEDCQCDDVQVDESALSQILRTTESFPVLKIDTDSDGAVSVEMETYAQGVQYVALSHVWADGLGNPKSNALPSCQIARVASSVAQLNRDMNGENTEQSTYRVWVDTICCPVEPEGKAIALDRITSVYENSTHVLVFDSSLTCLDTTTCEKAELLLRTFSCSPWMRRLWTLQEAILAKSVCIQFKDKAVPTDILMRELYFEGLRDMRRLRIWQDLLNEFNLLQTFQKASSGLEETYEHPQLIMLQRALHFRTVSVESDEPLCIATLMALKLEGLTLMTDGQQRMARIWGALAELFGGLSSDIVFFLEETLSIEGWRWAPKSLLGSMGKDSTLGLDERSFRFAVPKPKPPYAVGFPTPRGFRIQAKGGYLNVSPLREHLAIQPWKGVTKKTIEPYVLIYREATKEWYRAADWHRGRKLGLWSEEERNAYDETRPCPLFDSIRSNNAAMIFKDFDPNSQVMVGILGKVENVEDGGGAVDMNDKTEDKPKDEVDDKKPKEGTKHASLFKRERTIMFWRMREKDVKLINKVIAIANRLADDKVTTDLAACGNDESPERDECIAHVRKWLKDTVDEEWKSDPEFAVLVKELMGADMEGSTWPVILVDYSNIITMTDSAEDQVWIVD